MKIRNAMLRAAVLVCVLGLLSASNLGATAPGKDSLTVAAQTSTPLGVVPFIPGNGPDQHNWFYFYTCVPAGGTLTDTIPVAFTLNNTNGTSGQSTTIQFFNVAGSSALVSSITPPLDFGITDNGITQTPSIAINFTAPLSVPPNGNVYDANVQIRSTDPNRVQLDHDVIHIRVHVKDSCPAGGAVCFFTDSSFGALLDCSGVALPITSSSGGTFAIVVNAKNRIVATNPGQFYYNLIWTNDTGFPHDITLDLSKTDSTLSTMGTNSVHAHVFESAQVSLSSPLVSQFDVVNTDGTPCGATGSTCKATVTVQPNQILWVTWHLAYAKIGQPSSTVSPGACPGTEIISATCTVKDGDTALTTCTALASGYLKKQ